ncbi:XapX domain protein [Halobacteroides halobius DSM 5150]|uniref:XapX domain protein n=1 Tax=Halobacteroides halobius (strain ATCC 35273 / DSM 5150 / MD-1) TaxID=748449 RepID=L0K917_HALHC|nr:XapX domain-containing protein [Halobacteroides halobius]AGB41511.1 XapX domain protein [Halobacteroides halobius DSM 5150]
MKNILVSTISGMSVGFLFSLLKLPVPAPPTLGAVMGVVGIYLGFVLAQTIF